MKNNYEVRGNDVFIELNSNQVTVIDFDDLRLVSKATSLYACYDKTLPGYYVNCYINGNSIRLTTYLMNPQKGLEVDHIDRNTLNNRRCNLRNVTHSVNVHTQRIRPNNTSGFKGVSWVPHCHKFRARIQIMGKKIHLGMYEDPQEAARVVEKVRSEYVGGVYSG